MTDHSTLWSRVRWSFVVVVFALLGIAIAITANRLSDTSDTIDDQRARADRLEVQVTDLKAAAEEQDKILDAANEKLIRVGESPVVGAAGEQGLTGAPGAPGASGRQGPKGDPGLDGSQGERGPPGTAGTAGTPGAAGEPGAVGPPGPQGQQGEQGPKGDPGAPGTDAPTIQSITFDQSACAFVFALSNGTTYTAPMPERFCILPDL